MGKTDKYLQIGAIVGNICLKFCWRSTADKFKKSQYKKVLQIERHDTFMTFFRCLLFFNSSTSMPYHNSTMLKCAAYNILTNMKNTLRSLDCGHHSEPLRCGMLHINHHLQKKREKNAKCVFVWQLNVTEGEGEFWCQNVNYQQAR